MIVTLYSSRVVLNILGVEDYGVYNAVGGVVSVFAIISGALSNAISRYLTYSIGLGDKAKLRIVFSTSINIQIIISIAVLVFCEILGLWFLNNKMNIPFDRIESANYVLHFSLFTFVINLVSVPYNSCIIAHEHMKAYAYISIFDALLKLGILYFLYISPIDKLITYSILLFCSSLCVRILYGVYCRKYFEECKYKFVYNRYLFKEMLGFAGWNFFGNATSVLNIQGVNILINIFFGVVANSARGIASQVDAAVNQFVVTFSTAVNPQITKAYAHGNFDRMNYLICKGAKFSYFLLLVIAIPLLFEANAILKLWLVSVPNKAVTFMCLSLIGAMVNVLGNSGYTACLATGNIKKYSLVITLVGSLNFFITWFAYEMGAPAEMTYVIYIIVYIMIQIFRLNLMKELFGFPIIMYVKEVVFKIILPTITALIVPWLFVILVKPSLCRVFALCTCSVIWTICCVFVFGLTKGEKKFVLNKLKSKF